MYLHISHILKLQNGISVLNVSAGFKITLWTKSKLRKNKTMCDLTTRATKLNCETKVSVKVNKKGEKKNSTKKSKGLAVKGLPLWEWKL